MGKDRKVNRVLVRKAEGKRPLERPRWEDGIKMDLRESAGGGGAWSGFTCLSTEAGDGLL
jgi:hypothetical protein